MTEPFAEIWYCGDEECVCTQPQIVTRTPRSVQGGIAYDTTVLWEGTFLSNTNEYSTEELERLQYQPLRDACKRFGVPLPKELRGE